MFLNSGFNQGYVLHLVNFFNLFKSVSPLFLPGDINFQKNPGQLFCTLFYILDLFVSLQYQLIHSSLCYISCKLEVRWRLEIQVEHFWQEHSVLPNSAYFMSSGTESGSALCRCRGLLRHGGSPLQWWSCASVVPVQPTGQCLRAVCMPSPATSPSLFSIHC